MTAGRTNGIARKEARRTRAPPSYPTATQTRKPHLERSAPKRSKGAKVTPLCWPTAKVGAAGSCLQLMERILFLPLSCRTTRVPRGRRARQAWGGNARPAKETGQSASSLRGPTLRSRSMRAPVLCPEESSRGWSNTPALNAAPSRRICTCSKNRTRPARYTITSSWNSRCHPPFSTCGKKQKRSALPAVTRVLASGRKDERAVDP